MTTIERFNCLNLHDSKLVGLCVYKSDGEDRVKLFLEIPGKRGILRKAEITFKECAYFAADVYLEAKSLCSDDIAETKCYQNSDWKQVVSQPHPFDVIQGSRRLDQHLHFRISLIAPGGEINLLAKDFELLEAA